MTRCLFLLLAIALLVGASPGVAFAAETQRVAVVVGANLGPPGRQTLRYAHEDARRVAETLIAVGGFSPQDVALLLEPTPEAVLSALDQRLATAAQRVGETILFFYYSGHADDRAIFPAGQALPFAALKKRLEDPRARLRIGLVDSCRGGSFTGSKGLRRVDPFDVEGSPTLAEEGSVLIASSSGQENAHETEALQGSFFTHHWNAGLRGAADRGGDGIITLGEAFEYARSLTIRDTALIGQTPQHPSFQMKLAGRRDFPFSSLTHQHTTLLFEQSTGPVEFVRLSDGLVVVETTPGARRVRLELPAGSYLARRRASDGVWARTISLSAGATGTLRESELDRAILPSGRSKGGLEREAEPSWSALNIFGSFAFGVRHAPVIDPGLRLAAANGDGAFLLRFAVRAARHFWVSAPLALSFDAERQADFNWYAWAGVPVLAATHEGADGLVLRGFTAAGVDARKLVGGRHFVNATLAELGAFEWTQNGAYCAARDAAGACSAPRDHRRWPTTFTTQLTLGLSATIPSAVTFNIGAGLAGNFVVEGQFASSAWDTPARAAVVAFGSLQRVGLRPLPLIHVPLDLDWAIDAYAVLAYLPSLHGWVETYLAGVSYSH